MSFQDIVGHKTAINILKDELRTKRINHAYLFVGVEGVGKKLIAFQFARAYNCQEIIGDSCDSCLICQKINHFNHPDVQLLGIEEDEKVIKIEQIRQLQKEIIYKPYESDKKIYIIEDADKMTLEAANCLLKTLEEPPEFAVIILLAKETNKLLPTIVSRCQLLNLRGISRILIKEEIVKKGVSEKEADIYAGIAEGSIGKAITLAEDEEYLNTREHVFSFLSQVPEIDQIKIFTEVKEMIKLLENDFPLFDLLLSWYRDIIICKAGKQEQILNLDFLSDIQAQARIYTKFELIKIVNLINEIKRQIQLNVRKDLALAVMLLKIRGKRVS